MIIRLRADENKLTAISLPLLTSGSEENTVVDIECDNSWAEYDKTIVFKADENYLVHTGSETSCVVPKEALRVGELYVGLFGVKGNEVTPTIYCSVGQVEQGAYENGIVPPAPTPDVYSQILAECAETQEIAQSVRDDADNGVFTPVKGVDYMTPEDISEMEQDVVTELKPQFSGVMKFWGTCDTSTGNFEEIMNDAILQFKGATQASGDCLFDINGAVGYYWNDDISEWLPINGYCIEVEEYIINNLKTTEKTTVGAINELYDSIGAVSDVLATVVEGVE